MSHKQLTVPALKAALEFYSDPCRPFNEVLLRHTHPNGFEELISFFTAAENALTRIEALERELNAVYADPDVKWIRQAKHKVGR